jgi:hypothetical protein
MANKFKVEIQETVEQLEQALLNQGMNAPGMGIS